MSFETLNISKEIVKSLFERDIKTPTEIQEKAIPVLKSGTDIVGLSQTGTGKTLAFAIPMVERIDPDDDTVQALVLCPTRELCQQLTKEIKMLAQNLGTIRVVAVYGGADITAQIFNLKKRAQIIVGTPGRVLDHMRRHTLKLGNVSTLVLDEADEMLNMGFRADIESIIKKTPRERLTAMFSATMNNEVLTLAKNYLTNPKQIQVGQVNQTLDNIEQTYFVVPKDKKKKALHALLREVEKGTTLIFCNTKTMVGGVQSYLEKQGYPVAVIHGDMPQSQRSRVMRSYKAGEIDILVTTDVSARGIDVNNILNVINFDLPQNLEWYIHRIGRTGRAGKRGYAYTLLNSPEQAQKIKEIEKKTKSKIKLSRLQLDGAITAVPEKKPQKRAKALNTKKREIRNPNMVQSHGVLRTAGGKKLGTRTKTLRNVHKTKFAEEKLTKQEKQKIEKKLFKDFDNPKQSNRKEDFKFTGKAQKRFGKNFVQHNISNQKPHNNKSRMGIKRK